MNIVYNAIINCYSIILLLIIYFASIKQIERPSAFKLYITMLFFTIFLLIFDFLGRFDRGNYFFYILNHIGNFGLFFFYLIFPSLWVIYVCYQLNISKKIRKIIIYCLFFINFIYLISVLFSIKYGWYYYIEPDNKYQRGPYYLIPVIASLVFLFFTVGLTIVYRKRVERKFFLALMFFAVPPFICVIIQTLFYGISLTMNGVAISLLIIYLHIQNSNLYTDFVTGIYNRRRLEMYLKEKSNVSDKTFSAIMLDLDDFKMINDTLGHHMGDSALKAASKLLKNSLGRNDFIARYGGDEFFIVLDIEDENELKEFVNLIKTSFENYNQTHDLPYHLGLSIGYGVYDKKISVSDFQKELDFKMYENKKEKLSYKLK